MQLPLMASVHVIFSEALLPNEALIAGGTVVLALVTLYLAVVTHIMAREAERSRKSAESAAAAQYVQAERTFKQGHRAYLTVDSMLFITIVDQVPQKLNTILKNSGGSPALQVEVIQRFLLSDHWPRDIELDWDMSSSETKAPIGAGLAAPYYSEYLFEYKDTHNIREGNKKFVLYGKASYKDVFNELHELSWLYEYEPLQQLLVARSKWNTST